MTELKNKQCPFCGEYIPLDSEICKYCKESLVNNIETRSTYQEKGTNEVVQPDSEEKRTHTKTRLSYVLFLILATIVGGVLVLGMFFVVHRNIDVGFATNEQVKARPHILSKANNGNLEKAKQYCLVVNYGQENAINNLKNNNNVIDIKIDYNDKIVINVLTINDYVVDNAKLIEEKMVRV